MSQIKVELQETMGGDRSISDAAWTSSLTYQGKQKRTDEDVKRVVNMLADSKHSTPFESVIFRFWLKLPISCDRQFMTHRIQSASGMSGRYRSMPSEFLDMSEDVKDILNKMNFTILNEESDLISQYKLVCEKANTLYKNTVIHLKEAETSGLISNNEMTRAREFYRGVLPQHNMTERVSIMNLRAFANFIKLRDKPEAQPEIRKVAQLMLQAVENSNVAPIAIEALKRNNWNI